MIEKLPKSRIESLSDLIFGLALSIGALTLVGQQPSTFEEISAALGLYAFSFFILVGVWRSYSAVTSVLPIETETLTSFNILLLFVASVEPYLFNLLFTENGDVFNSISVIYAVDLAAMFLILAFFNHTLADEDKNRAPKEKLQLYRFERNYDIFIAGLFLVSALPIFESVTIGNAQYGLPLRIIIWIATLFLRFARRLIK